MRLGKNILEENVPGNRERREQLGLPWLSYSSDRYELGQAVSEAEQETGLDVKVGLWKNRRAPDEIVLIGKFAGDHDDAELPLYVVPVTPPKAAPAASAGEPRSTGRRLAKDERVLVKVAARVIRLERQVALLRGLALVAVVAAIGSLVTVAVMALLLLRR